MKKSFFVILVCLIGINSFSQKESEHFTFPAEFEKQDAVWMGWKSTITSRGLDKSDDLLRIMKAVTPFVKVNLLISHDSIRNVLYKEFEKRGIDKNRIQMFVYINPYSNVRDPGPVFLKSNKGNLMIADMKWNFYGTGPSSSPAAIRVDTVDQFVARKFNLPIRTSTIVSEGGAREFNGKGVMMAVEYTEMNRNKGISRDSIEKELLRMFGQKKIIWLKQGAAEDDPRQVFNLPSGKFFVEGPSHIDEFCRFASSNTILLAQVTKEESLKDTVHKISYERFEENFKILTQARDQDGNPFKIIRVPIPEMMTRTIRIDSTDKSDINAYKLPREGGTVSYFISTSYLNILITNGAVLMAKYWKPGRSLIIKQKDEMAKRIIQKAFPGRKIIQLDVEVLNEGSGGIHCATQQQPSRN